jgi:hypothetical protein
MSFRRTAPVASARCRPDAGLYLGFGINRSPGVTFALEGDLLDPVAQ